MSDYSEIDLAIALQLQAQFEEERRVHQLNSEKSSSTKASDFKKKSVIGKDLHEPEQEKLSVSLVDPTWELLDPSPKIHDLFLIFNDQFFWGRLSGIEVSWSPRMTLCAGVCSYEKKGGFCSVRLSVPLLKLRPRKDLVETLLHEMIHAYLFVTKNDTDHDGHGPQFHKHMYRINKIAGTKISVYHQFHDEVDVYRQHIWLCDGPCRKRRPYFGLLKRSMNRAPSERDPWWHQHQMSCGGTYSKIKEPEGYGVKSKKLKSSVGTVSKSKPTEDIRNFFSPPQDSKSNSADKENSSSNVSRLDLTSKLSSKNVGKNGNVHWINNGGNSKGWNANNFNTEKSSNESAKRNRSGKVGAGLGRKSAANSGSSTLTVGHHSSTKTKAPPSNVTSVSNFTPFAGQGHSLKSAESGTGVSRLLNLQSQACEFAGRSRSTSNAINMAMSTLNSVIPPEPSSSNSKFGKSPSSDEEDLSKWEKCPLCNKKLKTEDFDDHISLCLGNLDPSDDGFATSSNNVPARESRLPGLDINVSSASPSKKCRSHDDDDEVTDLEDSIMIVDVAESVTFIPSSQVDDDKLYSCPVCNEYFSESTISHHVNGHFS